MIVKKSCQPAPPHHFCCCVLGSLQFAHGHYLVMNCACSRTERGVQMQQGSAPPAPPAQCHLCPAIQSLANTHWLDPNISRRAPRPPPLQGVHNIAMQMIALLLSQLLQHNDACQPFCPCTARSAASRRQGPLTHHLKPLYPGGPASMGKGRRRSGACALRLPAGRYGSRARPQHLRAGERSERAAAAGGRERGLGRSGGGGASPALREGRGVPGGGACSAWGAENGAGLSGPCGAWPG